MNRPIALILIFFTLLTGCQKELKPSEMNPNDLPDERAFEDEFTREFLQSAEETRPGYYPFLSKTGKYKMDFPAGGVITKQPYTLKKSNFEFLSIGILNPDESEARISLTYYSENQKDKLDLHLNQFQGRIGKDIDFEAIEKDNATIFYSNFQRNNFNNYVAYIQRNNESGGIELLYSNRCVTSNGCNEDGAQRKAINDWIESVEFIKDDVYD